MKIKICGITNIQDAEICDLLGVDFIGLNFSAHSPRQIDLATAEKICNSVSNTKVVGLFIEHDEQLIYQYCNLLGLHAVQLYRPITCRIPNCKIIQATRIANQQDIKPHPFTDFILCDAFDHTKLGGSGKTFDWNLLPKDKSKIFLAGGINPKNIRQACEQQTYAIDICSGVEERPGIKNPKLLKDLFKELNYVN